MKKMLILTFIFPMSCDAMEWGNELKEAALIAGGAAASAVIYRMAAHEISSCIDRGGTLAESYIWARGQADRTFKITTWGMIGDWWIGIPLVAAARIGSHQLSAPELIKPLASAYAATALVSLVSGMYTAAITPGSTKKRQSISNAAFASRAMGTLGAPLGIMGYILVKRFRS